MYLSDVLYFNIDNQYQYIINKIYDGHIEENLVQCFIQKRIIDSPENNNIKG